MLLKSREKADNKGKSFSCCEVLVLENWQEGERNKCKILLQSQETRIKLVYIAKITDDLRSIFEFLKPVNCRIIKSKSQMEFLHLFNIISLSCFCSGFCSKRCNGSSHISLNWQVYISVHCPVTSLQTRNNFSLAFQQKQSCS